MQTYVELARPISPSWDTAAVPAADFRRLARPPDAFFGGNV